MSLLDAVTLHAINVERYSANTIADIVKLLDASANDVEVILRRKGDAIRTGEKKRLQSLITDLKEMRAEAFRALKPKLEKDLVDLAKYEVEFQEALGKALAPAWSFGRPTPKLLKELVTNEPIAGAHLQAWVDKLRTDDLFKINQQIRLGMVEGESIDQIVKRVVGYREKGGAFVGTKKNASMLVRTATTAVKARAEHAFMVENGYEEYMWVSVLDERTTDICRGRAGEIYKVNDGPLPPAHINCLPGDALVATSEPATGCSKRWFEGDMIIIRTAAGNELACTPNHPVLTDAGWKPAQFVKQGDKVFKVGPTDNEQGRPAPISKVWQTLAEAPGTLGCTMPITAKDFHGDGIDGQVGIVYANRGLLADRVAERTELLRETVLGLAPMGQSELARLGSLLALFNGTLPPPNGGVRLGSEFLSLAWRGTGHAGGLLLATPTEFNAILAEDTIYDTWADAEHLRNAARADAGHVKLVDVVEVERRNFSGHVYNLITTDGLILAHGLVTHNCRSTVAAIPPGFPKDNLKDFTFDAWLKRVAPEVAIQALGFNAYKLWKKGSLKTKGFIDPTRQTYSLSQLKAADKIAVDLVKEEISETAGAKDYSALPWHELVKLDVTTPKAKTLPQRLKDALRRYTGSDYRAINDHLRGKADYLQRNQEFIDRMNGDIAKIDEAMSMSRVRAPIVVRRFWSADMRKKFDSLRVGGKLVDEAYVSTTTGTRFVGHEQSGFGFKITIPKGVNGVYVPDVSLHSPEAELLLPRGSVFNIKARKTVPYHEAVPGAPEVPGKKFVWVELELVPKGKR